jgi:hypothetical protein
LEKNLKIDATAQTTTKSILQVVKQYENTSDENQLKADVYLIVSNTLRNVTRRVIG